MNHGIRTRLAGHQYLKRTGRPNLKPIPLSDPRPDLGAMGKAQCVQIFNGHVSVWIGGNVTQKFIHVS